MTTKICNKCNVEQDITFYFKDKKIKSGYRGQCKACIKNYDLSKAVKAVDNDKQGKICKICNLYKMINNYFTSKQTLDGYYGYCKSCSNNKKQNNPNAKLKAPEYRAKHKLIYGEVDKLKKRERYKNDIAFKISCTIRSRVNQSLKTKFTKHTVDIIGCNIDFFKQWIEYQFEDWMSWDNFGDWHLDHVRPCASFDLSDKEQQLLCFSWKNYQPLQKELNLKKNDKVFEDLIMSHKQKADNFLLLTSKEGEGSETRTSILKVI